MRKLRHGDLAVVVALGIVARSWILFSTPLVPGINGAYYLVQARSLLEKGRLAIPDFPLTFFLHAFLAKWLQILGAAPLETAVLWAIKLTDAIFPPLAALPIYLVIRGWKVTQVRIDAARSSGAGSENNGRSQWIALAAAAVIALGAPALSMVGDFQKNSLAFVWLAGFIYASWQFLSRENCLHKRAAGASALGLLALIGLTHIGVFGGALVLAIAIVASHLLVRGGVNWRKIAVYGTAGAVVPVAVTAVVTWRFDPARVKRLVHAFSNPEQFLSIRNSMGQPPGGPPGFGGTGVPLLFAPIRFVPFAIIGGIGMLAIFSAWPRRRQTRGDAAIVMGSAGAAVALTGPWFSFDMAMRLMLIAVIPAVVALSYTLVQVRWRWVQVIGGIAPLILLIGAAIPQIARGGQPIISMGVYQELQAVGDTLRDQLPESERTLVVAMHGLEWWSAWVLHTHVAQAQAVHADDWQRFESLLFLEVKNGLQFPGPPSAAGPGGMPGFPGAPHGDFGRSGPGSADGEAGRAFGSRGKRSDPPSLTQADGSRHGPSGSSPMFPPRGPMPMMGAPIPSGAEIVHEGKFLRLARVRTPPEFVIGSLH